MPGWLVLADDVLEVAEAIVMGGPALDPLGTVDRSALRTRLLEGWLARELSLIELRARTQPWPEPVHTMRRWLTDAESLGVSNARLEVRDGAHRWSRRHFALTATATPPLVASPTALSVEGLLPREL